MVELQFNVVSMLAFASSFTSQAQVRGQGEQLGNRRPPKFSKTF